MHGILCPRQLLAPATNLGGPFRFFDSACSQVGVIPAAESILGVPSALAVSQHRHRVRRHLPWRDSRPPLAEKIIFFFPATAHGRQSTPDPIHSRTECSAYPCQEGEGQGRTARTCWRLLRGGLWRTEITRWTMGVSVWLPLRRSAPWSALTQRNSGA